MDRAEGQVGHGEAVADGAAVAAAVEGELMVWYGHLFVVVVCQD